MTKKTKSAVENQHIYQHAKGVVKDNAVMALLHDKLFRQRVEKKRKGKGSYQRKAKYASFGQAWQRLGSALPKLGFKATSESAGRGYRELKYKPLDKQEWLRLGLNPPNLEKGVYQMQISAVGKQSAVVITDEDGKALPNEAAQSLYSALGVLLAQ